MSLHHEIEEGKDSLQAMVPDKKNQVRWMVSMAIAIVIIIAGALLFSGNLIKMINPGAYVAKSISHMTETLSKEQEAVKKLPLYVVMENNQEKPVEEQGSLSLTQLPEGLEEYNFLTNLGLSFDIKSDMKGRKALAEIDAQYSNISLISASILADDNILSLNIPALMESTYYGIDTSKWVADFNQSPFGEAYGTLPFGEDANFNVFDRAKLYQVKDSKEALQLYFTKETLDQNKKLQKELFKSIDFKNAGKEITQVNGRDLSCSKVTATVAKEDLLSYVKNAYELLKKDENFTAYMESSIRSQAVASGMSPSQLLGEVWIVYDQLIDQLSAVLSENVECVFYVNGKNMVKLTASSAINAQETAIPVTLNVQIGGEKHLADHLYGEFKIKNEDLDFRMILDCKGNHTGENGAFNSDTKVTVDTTDPFSGEQAKVEALVSMNYDAKQTENNAGITYGISLTENDFTQELFTLTSQGTLVADPSAGTINGDFEDVQLSVMGEKISMAADWSVQPLKVTEETFPQVEPVMVFSMTEDEVNDAVERMAYTGMSYVGGLISTGKLNDLASLILR